MRSTLLALSCSFVFVTIACNGRQRDDRKTANVDAGLPDKDAAQGEAPPHEMPFVRRKLAQELLARKAVCYSGYRAQQSPHTKVYPSADEVREDLRILIAGGFGLVRLFDSGPHAERVLEVIDHDKLDLKVMLGIWINGAKAEHDLENRAAIDAAVELATKYSDEVVALSVGNETLPDWSFVKTPALELAAYMRALRTRVVQPVTTDDSFVPFLLGREGGTSYDTVIEVARAADFLSLHIYAFSDAFGGNWDWKQESTSEAARPLAMMDAALAHTREAVTAVRATMADQGLDDIQVLIGEAGWKDRTEFKPDPATPLSNDTIEHYFAHPINQQYFYDELMAWAYGEKRAPDAADALFWFEAFDEPWKRNEGDDHWGLLDTQRRAKYVMWDELGELKPPDASEPDPATMACYRP